MRIISGPGSFRIDTWQELWEAMFRALGFAMSCSLDEWCGATCPSCNCYHTNGCDYCLYECYDGGPR